MLESDAFAKDSGEVDMSQVEQQVFQNSSQVSGSSANPNASGEQSGGSLVAELFRWHWRAVLIGIGGAMTAAITTYVSTVWSVTYLKSQGLPDKQALWVGVVVNVVQFVLVIPVGWLTDVKGVGWVRILGALAMAALGLPIFIGINAYPTSMLAAVMGVGLGYGVIGAINAATLYLFIVELFPTKVRNLGIGVSLNVSFTIFGGCGPLIAQASLKMTPAGPGIMMSVIGIITAVVLAWGFHLGRKKRVRLAHIRPTPYFGKISIVEESQFISQ